MLRRAAKLQLSETLSKAGVTEYAVFKFIWKYLGMYDGSLTQSSQWQGDIVIGPETTSLATSGRYKERLHKCSNFD